MSARIVAELTQVRVSALPNHIQRWTSPPNLFKSTHINEKDRKDEIIATQIALASKKLVKLRPAKVRQNHARRDDRDDETRLSYRGVDLGLPRWSQRNRFEILPKAERVIGATKLGAKLIQDARPQQRHGAVGLAIILRRINEQAE